MVSKFAKRILGGYAQKAVNKLNAFNIIELCQTSNEETERFECFAYHTTPTFK